MTTHSKTTTERKIQRIISSEMVLIRKMKKTELLLLVESLMGDVLRELDEYTINDLVNEL